MIKLLMLGVCLVVKLLFILVYLKLHKNTDALSIVMGHEIAHAVARHSVERMSHAMTINLGTTVADIFLGGAINRTRNTVGKILDGYF